LTPKKSVLTAAMVGAFVIGASACGSDGGHFDGKSPADIVDESRQAMLGLTSMSMKAEFTDAEGTTAVTTSFTTDGECTGSISMPQGDAEFMTVGDNSYMKANDAFWDEDDLDGAALNGELDGRWIMMPAGQSGYDAFCQMEAFLSGLEDSADEDDSWESADGQKINGTSTVAVSQSEDDGTTTMYVADSEDAYIIRMTREGDEQGQADFSDFNKDFGFEAPSEDDVVAVEELETLG
jgi:hypothetical protein